MFPRARLAAGGVCFSWDVANIDNLTDWEPPPALTADT